MNKTLLEKTVQIFKGDRDQLKVLKSENKRIIIEAPPGYGKTKVLISKTLYDLIKGNPKNHEKVLMLTFSINSASKMREDLNAELQDYPKELQSQLRNKTYITNFHGFARSILSKYGHLLDSQLRDIGDFEVLAEYQLDSVKNLKVLTNYAKAIKEVKIKYMNEEMNNYNSTVIEELLPHKILTHNSLLTLTIQLLMDNIELLESYKRLYTKIVIDEFQDTNFLNIKLIELFLNDNLYIELYGDPLQRIYGFIGTVENIFDEFGEKHNFKNYKLQTNYRFKDNKNMLLLEKRIRKVANRRLDKKEQLRQIDNSNIIKYVSHLDEVKGVIEKINIIQEETPDKNIAILTPRRGADIDQLITELELNKLDYFNALKVDVESEIYTDFCLQCVSTFQAFFVDERRVIKKELNAWYKQLQKEYLKFDSEVKELFTILRAFLNNVVTESVYRQKTDVEKKEYILNIFLNKELHYYLSFINGIQVLTIHTAKGLEWDKVFLIDAEKDKLPNQYAMCQPCKYKGDCNLELDDENEKDFLEQLSLFYVAVTRARNEIYISGSLWDALDRKTEISCIFGKLNILPQEYILT